MTKETENLLRKYWYEGYSVVLISKDNKVFITKGINGWSYTSEELFNKSAEEVAYLPNNELKNLFSEKNRSADISELINVVDWEKVKVDTPLTIRNSNGFYNAHFCKYENGKVYVFLNGMTSWTARNTDKNTIYYLPEHIKAYLAPEEEVQE